MPEIVELLFSNKLIEQRVQHRWSGNFGTIRAGYPRLLDHAIIEWDNDNGRRLPYRLDVCDIIENLTKELAMDKSVSTFNPRSRLYLHLFHGRITKEEEVKEWGVNGPVFGPFAAIHTEYARLIRCVYEDGDEIILKWDGDLIFYDNIFYGAMSAQRMTFEEIHLLIDELSTFNAMKANKENYKVK